MEVRATNATSCEPRPSLPGFRFLDPMGIGYVMRRPSGCRPSPGIPNMPSRLARRAVVSMTTLDAREGGRPLIGHRAYTHQSLLAAPLAPAKQARSAQS